MKKNLEELSTQLYCAVSNWNDETISNSGDRFLTEHDVADLVNMLYDVAVDRLGEEDGLV